jgi:hypothetical protein
MLELMFDLAALSALVYVTFILIPSQVEAFHH